MQGILCRYRGREIWKLEFVSYCLQSNLLSLFLLASVLAPSGPFSTGILSPAVPAHEDPLPAGFGLFWVQGVG